MSDIEVVRIYGPDDVFRVWHGPTGAFVDIPVEEVWSWRDKVPDEEETRTRVLRLAYQTLRRLYEQVGATDEVRSLRAPASDGERTGE